MGPLVSNPYIKCTATVVAALSSFFSPETSVSRQMFNKEIGANTYEYLSILESGLLVAFPIR